MVIAAAIPAVLSIGGGFVFLKAAADENISNSVAATVFIVVFCIFFYLAALQSNKARIRDASSSQRELEKKHYLHLELCSKAEVLYNQARISMKLSPLGSDYYCRKIQ